MRQLHPDTFSSASLEQELGYDLSGINPLNMAEWKTHPSVVAVSNAIARITTEASLISGGHYSPGVEHHSSQVGIFLSALWSHACWRECRRQVYRVSDGLADIILRSPNITDKVRVGDFILPHQSLFIVLPEGVWTLYNPTTGVHQVEGVYVTDTRAQACMVESASSSTEEHRYLSCLITAGPGSTASEAYGSMYDESGAALDDEINHFVMRMDEGKTVSQCFEDTLERTIDKLTPVERDSIKVSWSVLQFVLGAMIYATSANAEYTLHIAAKYAHLRKQLKRLSSHRKRKKAAYKRRIDDCERRLGTLATRRYINLGESIQKKHEPCKTGGKHRPHYVQAHEQTYWVKEENVPKSVDGERRWLAKRVNDIGTQLFKVRKFKLGGWRGLEDGEAPPPPDGREHVLG